MRMARFKIRNTRTIASLWLVSPKIQLILTALSPLNMKMNMSEGLVIVLVHGFWGGAAHWSKVIEALAVHGYRDVSAVELPHISGG